MSSTWLSYFKCPELFILFKIHAWFQYQIKLHFVSFLTVPIIRQKWFVRLGHILWMHCILCVLRMEPMAPRASAICPSIPSRSWRWRLTSCLMGWTLPPGRWVIQGFLFFFFFFFLNIAKHHCGAFNYIAYNYNRVILIACPAVPFRAGPGYFHPIRPQLCMVEYWPSVWCFRWPKCVRLRGGKSDVLFGGMDDWMK